jgi:4-hydroxy-tetrahydrodipicolinate synthase
MLNNQASGVYVIASTPFHADGAIDNQSIDCMVDAFHSFAVNEITVLGQMGEAQKLDHEEALAVASRVIRRSKVPVIVGVSAPGFAAMRSLAKASMDAGCHSSNRARKPILRDAET